MVGCPIRISADQFVCANPRSFSQLITSFIASESLGIPHTLLFSLLYFCLLMSLSTNTLLALVLVNIIFWYDLFKSYLILCIFFQYVNERFPKVFSFQSQYAEYCLL